MRPDPGPFRWFWAAPVRKPCPACGHPTSVGFDHAHPGASTRRPARCVQCTTAEIDNAIQFARGELGYPLTEQGMTVGFSEAEHTAALAASEYPYCLGCGSGETVWDANDDTSESWHCGTCYHGWVTGGPA